MFNHDTPWRIVFYFIQKFHGILELHFNFVKSHTFFFQFDFEKPKQLLRGEDEVIISDEKRRDLRVGEIYKLGNVTYFGEFSKLGEKNA